VSATADPYATMKDFRRIYEQEGAYHQRATGFRGWFLEDNYRALAAECGPADRVLDLACGEGCLAPHVPGRTLVGVDYSEVALQLNRELHPGVYAELIVGDLRRLDALPLGRGSFDTAVCSLSLMYLVGEDLRGCLRAVRALLRPGGAFAFTYPAVHALRPANDTAAELTPATLRALLAQAGFVEERAVPFCPLVPREVVARSEDPAQVVAARAVYEAARRGMTLDNCYHWLYRGLASDEG
jgi:SAM-dependent methyltransferase